MSLPQVPPRPSRAHQSALGMTPIDLPTVPPRPQRRTSERSQSPDRDHYPRSPFHELPAGKGLGSVPPSGLRSQASHDSLDTPRRPPSVSMPSVGQEGNEYADLELHPVSSRQSQTNLHAASEPLETRNVAGDLPLHAPKPSLAKDDAKKRVASVTRTDSSQVSVLAYGSGPTPSSSADIEKTGVTRTLKQKRSFRAPSVEPERPGSAKVEDEHGIPEIGQRVPMFPDAGDVQAPSPAPTESLYPSGIGFHNSGSSRPSRHHKRTPSGREMAPPGSYGLHGHGMGPADQFEQQWYAKHPEALEREEGEYAPGISGGRPDWALSSEDLNKLVYDTARHAKIRTGVPNEQIGYQASEEYTSRIQTPHTPSFKMNHSTSSFPLVESPLRKSSFPVNDASHAIQRIKSYESPKKSHENALESETEGEDELNVSPPTTRTSKYTGSGYDPPTQDLGPTGGNTARKGGFIEEGGYGVPILASDEVARTPGAEFQQPAVSPPRSRRGSGFVTDAEHVGFMKTHSRSGSNSNSRPSSRPGSVHNLTLSRFQTLEDDRDTAHTPLENVEEYEPLFPDDEQKKAGKPMTVADRLKPRERMKRFPSQDIWEDTPNSLQLETTVDSPEPTPTAQSFPAGSTFETPEQEAARKGEVSEADRARLLSKQDRLARSAFKPHIRDEIHRPPAARRFPSRDIWEDSPDSAELTTTIEPHEEADAGLEAGAVVNTSARPKDGIMMGEQPRVPPRPERTQKAEPPEPLDLAQPPAPARLGKEVPMPDMSSGEASPLEMRRVPLVPERPKPQVPARPSKNRGSDASESASQLSKVTSTGSDGASDRGMPPPKPPTASKPIVPARPAGSKIAALQSGFMADLNSRLKLGPQAPIKQAEKASEGGEAEEVAEKVPLNDARKGRARGPARKKPAAAVAAEDVPSSKAPLSLFKAVTVWQTDETGAISLAKSLERESKLDAAVEQPVSSHEAAPADTTEPIADPVSQVPSKPAEGLASDPAAPAAQELGITEAAARDETVGASTAASEAL